MVKKNQIYKDMAEAAKDLNEDNETKRPVKYLYRSNFNNLGEQKVKLLIHDQIILVLEAQEEQEKQEGKGALTPFLKRNIKGDDQKGEKLKENKEWIKRNIGLIRDKTYARINWIFSRKDDADYAVTIINQIGKTIQECLQVENTETQKEAHQEYKEFMRIQWKKQQEGENKKKKKKKKGPSILDFTDFIILTKKGDSPYKRWRKIRQMRGVIFELGMGETVPLTRINEKGNLRYVLTGITKHCLLQFKDNSRKATGNPARFQRA